MIQLLQLRIKPSSLQGQYQTVEAIRVNAHAAVAVEERQERGAATNGTQTEIPLPTPPPTVCHESKVVPLRIDGRRATLKGLHKFHSSRAENFFHPREFLGRVRRERELP
eukprot:3630416-Pyramimonas_sp.AAC.1